MTTQLPDVIADHDAEAIVGWAHREFGSGLVFTSSFEDPVLVHLVSRHAPGTPIVLLDTQYLFPETLAYANELRQRFDFPLEIIHPAVSVSPDEQWKDDVEGCCGRRKVEPLQRALSGRTAWITGVRRVDAPTRAHTPAVAFDVLRNVTKVNPLVAWSDDDVDAYMHSFDLPPNPLTSQGYASIGCWPCTRPVAPGEDRRAGRWSGLQKTECGLHVQ